MKFKENDTVKVMKDCGNVVKRGDIGVVIMVFEKPNEAYEVEFVDKNGFTKAQNTFLPSELELA